MPVSFEGFPRVIDRKVLRPARWFVASEGVRPLICFSTDEGEDEDLLILTFSNTRPEAVDFAPTLLKGLTGPIATLEHDVVFTPGWAARPSSWPRPCAGRSVRAPCCACAANPRVGFATAAGALAAVSFATGQRAEGYDLVFDRWSLFLKRGLPSRRSGTTGRSDGGCRALSAERAGAGSRRPTKGVEFGRVRRGGGHGRDQAGPQASSTTSATRPKKVAKTSGGTS